jgi:hypothetical protein
MTFLIIYAIIYRNFRSCQFFSGHAAAAAKPEAGAAAQVHNILLINIVNTALKYFFTLIFNKSLDIVSIKKHFESLVKKMTAWSI